MASLSLPPARRVEEESADELLARLVGGRLSRCALTVEEVRCASASAALPAATPSSASRASSVSSSPPALCSPASPPPASLQGAAKAPRPGPLSISGRKPGPVSISGRARPAKPPISLAPTPAAQKALPQLSAASQPPAAPLPPLPPQPPRPCRAWWQRWDEDGRQTPPRPALPPQTPPGPAGACLRSAALPALPLPPLGGAQQQPAGDFALPLPPTKGVGAVGPSEPAPVQLPLLPLAPKSAHASSVASCDSSDESQVGGARSTLMDMFPDLAGIVPDVLAVCKDPRAAFDKLQQMQECEEDAALSWAQAPPQPPAGDEQADLDLCVGILAEQFPLPRAVLEATLRRTCFDLAQASRELVAQQEALRQRQVAQDRALAQQVSATLAHSSSPSNPQAGVSWAERLSPAQAAQLELLATLFPPVPAETLHIALEASLFDTEAARQILRDGGHTEVARPPLAPPEASLPQQQLEPAQQPERQAAAAPDSSLAAAAAAFVPRLPAGPPPLPPPPPRAAAPRQLLSPSGTSPYKPSDDAVYLETRAQAQELNRELLALTQQLDELREAGRHTDAACVEGAIRSLQKKRAAADKAARRKIFDSMNKDRCALRQLDLHGMHVQESIEMLDDLVNACLKDRFSDTLVELITGKGNRSRDGLARVRQAVANYCRQRGIVHTQMPDNAGVICFRVARGSELKPYNKSTLLW